MPPSATKRVYFSTFLMSSGAMTCFGQKKVSESEIWHFRREKPGVRAHPPCFHPPLGAARVARVKAEPPTAWAPGCCAGAGLRGRPLAAAQREQDAVRTAPSPGTRPGLRSRSVPYFSPTNPPTVSLFSCTSGGNTSRFRKIESGMHLPNHKIILKDLRHLLMKRKKKKQLK